MDGKRIALPRREALGQRVAALKERRISPKLAVILASADPATLSYLRVTERLAAELGIAVQKVVLSSATSEAFVRRIAELGEDPTVSGILVETPLPAGVDAGVVRGALPPEKDVDGAGTASLGRLLAGERSFVPATAGAVLALLDGEGIDVSGRRAAIVGRSLVVGRPLALLLLARDATVTVCHSKTQDLAAVTREADLVCVAVGRPGFLGVGMVRPGAVVVDVGTNWVDGRIVGDVDFPAVAPLAGAISPVPGGVGPLTTTILMEQVVEAAERIAR
ncbi:MAG: bifunctional 5,10-methylene-tetrahydrofolate dehydrogenase/5,10-methylene-tetrahydrofolate cyclohydrolase [Candidatus Bipolaricaulota bacterium]|nr:bifunctional 5,10-methylene-tetrahydrofolate dehydrogenase/5,10-methylene-tetrahydrofolate cyclohydrolase [Candidatus Bipolaricaulota bacterium]